MSWKLGGSVWQLKAEEVVGIQAELVKNGRVAV
jgi:hypothetical protein